jgi:hypothetical protein
MGMEMKVFMARMAKATMPLTVGCVEVTTVELGDYISLLTSGRQREEN